MRKAFQAMNLSRRRKGGAMEEAHGAQVSPSLPAGTALPPDQRSMSEYSGYDDSYVSSGYDDDLTGYDDETSYDDDDVTGYDDESVPYSEDNSMRRLGTGFHGQVDSFEEPYDELSMYDDEEGDFDEYASDYDEDATSDATAHAEHDDSHMVTASSPVASLARRADRVPTAADAVLEEPRSLPDKRPLDEPVPPVAAPAARKGFFRRFSRFSRNKQADLAREDPASKRASLLASIAQRKDHAQELRSDAEAALRGDEPVGPSRGGANFVGASEPVLRRNAALEPAEAPPLPLAPVARSPSPISSVDTETGSVLSDPYAPSHTLSYERSQRSEPVSPPWDYDAQSTSSQVQRSWQASQAAAEARPATPTEVASLRRPAPIAAEPAMSDAGSASTRPTTNATSTAPVRLVGETSGRLPQLVDPFGESRALHPSFRRRSIEPSVLDGEATSVHPSSPLMPRTGPLSGHRISDPSSLGRSDRALTGHKASPSTGTTSDFYSVHTASPQASPALAVRERVPRAKPAPSDVPPVPPLPPSISGSSTVRPAVAPSSVAPVRPPRAMPKKSDFRGLEHKTPASRMRRLQRQPREFPQYLLTPSNAPTESDTDEELVREARGASGAAAQRSWLLRDLTPEQTHYLLRDMVSKELTWEWDRLFLLTSFDKPATTADQAVSDADSRAGDFDDVGDMTDDEAVFRRDVYDPSPTAVDLPLVRFLLRHAFCTFPLFVVPDKATKQGRAPNKAAIAHSFFFTAVMPLVREMQARSLSSAVERDGQSDGMPFMAQSVLRALGQLIHKWATRYVTAVLRVGPGSPYYGAEPVHNVPLPWPNAKLLPPEAFVSYRRPTERLRLGGMEVDIIAVREHMHHSRDFLLRIRRPNRMDEFVVRNDHDWDEFRAKLAQELGPFVHVRPLPRLPGRAQLATPSEETPSTVPDSASYETSTGYEDNETSPYDESSYDTESTLSTSRPPEGLSAADILQPLYGPRQRPVPRFEVDRRLLRSWLRDTLAIRSIGESNEVRAFLGIGSFHDRELDTDELLNIAERRRVDARRIEEREKDAEMAGEYVLSIRRIAQRIWVDCVDGDGFLKMYDAIKVTPEFEELPTSYQTMVSWGHLQAARFLYGIFVQGDQSRANLGRIRDLVDTVPWRKLANALRLPSIQAVREWQKQFLRNRFLQSLFQILYDDDPIVMDENLRALQQEIASDTMIRKLRLYVESPEDMKRLVRQHADQADIPLVAAIVRGSDTPKLTRADVERVMAATREYKAFLQTYPNAVRRRQNQSAGYQLILNLQRVLRIYSLHRDVTQIRGMLQDPAILDALTVFFEPLLEALVRVQRVDGVREDVLYLHAFLLRLLDLLESLRARVQDPARSINTIAVFLDRAAPAWYNFLHRLAQVDPTVFSTFAWLRHLAMTIGAGSDDLASLWAPPVAARDASPLSEAMQREVQGLYEAARRKRGRQMEIASRWAAGDTEADFSIQVLGDGTGRMRRDPFLPKEPAPAPKAPALAGLLRSFREAVSSALAR
ncbi:hypothetical protein MEQU1_003113 [Malassezia equina]|uniref:DUF3818 domain-containing protein n=1 Tax=Malassezia equina TaxID=1381935 RepID=A0AAF0J1F0_9BASI|nr:hypothetical protein MEQU1_003113 [Malassezia equina]